VQFSSELTEDARPQPPTTPEAANMATFRFGSSVGPTGINSENQPNSSIDQSGNLIFGFANVISLRLPGQQHSDIISDCINPFEVKFEVTLNSNRIKTC